MLACRREENLFVAADSRRTIRRRGESVVDGLATPPRFADCRVETRLRGNRIDSPSAGCLGTLGCRNDGTYMKVVVDIADNTVVAWHDPRRSAKLSEDELAGSGKRTYLLSTLLFADGKRLLLQQEIWTPLLDGPSAFKSIPGRLVRTVDTRTGQVTNDNPRAVVGTVSRVFCRGSAERAVISGGGEVHLFDPNTLQPTGTMSVPFERYWVF